MTTTAERASARPGSEYVAPQVEIVIPVFNEVGDLERSVRRLHAHLSENFPFSARITIADNASTDATWEEARRLANSLPDVRAVHLDEKGRGRALRAVWSSSDAAVLAYMDVDLSTDLNALLPLVAPLVSGHSDVAIGSRLGHGARTVRGPKRELISRAYNALLKATLAARFSDAQCGFKAIRADRARQLLPLVEDTGWFFDTELLVLAERSGLRIHEVPVDWIDDPDSRVDVVATAIADLKGVARLVRGLATRRIAITQLRDDHRPPSFAAQVLRFGVIGVASTAAYLVLYVLLRHTMSAQLANASALLVTAIGNTAANRRWTFAVRGRDRAAVHQAQGLAVFLAALALTSAALAAMHAVTDQPSQATELAVLVLGNLSATVLRFTLLRAWVFRAQRTPVPSGGSS